MSSFGIMKLLPEFSTIQNISFIDHIPYTSLNWNIHGYIVSGFLWNRPRCFCRLETLQTYKLLDAYLYDYLIKYTIIKMYFDVENLSDDVSILSVTVITITLLEKSSRWFIFENGHGVFSEFLSLYRDNISQLSDFS